MADNSSGAIPPSPAADPAAGQSGSLQNVTQYLNQIGVNASAATNVLQSIQSKISSLTTDVPTTVGGYLQNVTDRLQASGISFKPANNVLDNYSTYTYHIKFCVTSDDYSLSVDGLDKWQNVPKEVIAESGVTDGFNIKNFEIDNICSPQQRIGIATQIGWKMTIAEPYGLSLVDRLYTLGRTLGVANHLKCKYFIELWFLGIKDDGTPAEPVKHKLWRVVINEMNVDNNESGSTYSIEGIIDNTMGHGNELSIVPNTVVVKEVETFQQFWQSFKDQLNEQMRTLDYDNSSKRVEYDFVLPNSWKNWKFTRTSSDNSRQSGFDFTNPNKPTITITRGSDIQKVLITVMSMTQEGRNFTLGPSGTSSATGKSSSQAVSQGLALIPHLQSKVEFVGYNYLYNDYVRKVTFYFNEYPTTRSYLDRQFIDNSEQPDVQKARLKNFVDDARLIKAYYYTFTGLNTDILKFDIKFDPYWSAVQPPFDGYNNSTTWDLPPQVNGQSVPQNILNQFNKATRDYSDALNDVNKLKNLDKKDQKEDYQNNLQAANDRLVAAQTTLQTFKGINTADYEIRFGNSSPGEQSLEGIIIKNKDLLNDPKIREDIASRAAYKITRKSIIGDRYLESIRPQDVKANPLPISTVVSRSPTQQNNSPGGIGQNDPMSTQSSKSQPKTRGLLAASLDNVMSSQFLEIELEIRGDPYWMGFDNIEGAKFLDPNIKPTLGQRRASAGFANGECAFLLFFRTGEEPNEDTGFVEFNTTSWAFNGLYVVIEVTNHFKDGQFTQTLKAIKDSSMYSAWRGVQQK
jgi:hypothetical protein